MQPRRVLVGFDARGRSDFAVLAALDLQRDFGTTVEVAHVVDVPPVEAMGGRPDKAEAVHVEVLARARDAALERLEGLVGDARDVSAEKLLTLLRGHPSKALIERARETGVDMIMLGPHEKHGIFDFGSTARAVLGRAGVHVWMQPGEPRPIERILVPTDLSEDSDLALGTARILAQGFGAHITLLHCYVPPALAYPVASGYGAVAAPHYLIEEERRAEQERFEHHAKAFEWSGVEHTLEFIEGSPAESILERVDRHDLIVMGSHGRTGLSAFLLGNVAYSVLRGSPIPVLATRNQSRRWVLDGAIAIDAPAPAAG